MGFDETYDEMLHREFGSSGPRAASAAAPLGGDVRSAADVPETTAPTQAEESAPSTASSIHRAFRANGVHAAAEVPTDDDGPRGLTRYRTAALVGAGGLSCAAIGAFLGGLGGSFTVNPAAAHPLATSTGSSQQLATAVDQAYRVADNGGSSDATAVVFSSPSGSLAQGVDPLQWLTTSRSANVLVTSPAASDLPGVGDLGSGSGSGGLGLGCTTQADLGVDCIVSSVTGVLGNLGADSSGPAGVVDELVPSLNGVVADVTGTLSDLGALLPIGSVPTAGLPTAVLDALGLASGGSDLGTGLASLGSLGSSLGSLSSLGAGGVGSLRASGATTGPLNGILGAAGAAASSTTGALSSTAGPPGLPSLPVTAPTGSVSSSASSGKSTATSTSTTTTTQPSRSGSSGTTATVPLPSLPLPSTPPVSLGGVSVGVNSGSSGSGLSLSLP